MSMAAASSKAREAVKLPANGDEDDGAIPIVLVESNREKMNTVYNLLLPSRDRPASHPSWCSSSSSVTDWSRTAMDRRCFGSDLFEEYT
jgi:hypothetical protein